jgi:1,4-dihydroxy-2-naphthoate octaprenyltransferase
MSNASLGAWLLAARPKTLAAGLTPVVIGAAMAQADGQFHAVAVLCCALGALLIQIGTNYANDYFDFVKGTDTAERVGPKRATQAGLVTPRQMLLATTLVFALAFVPGAYLMLRGGWPIVAIGLVSVACGVLYTGGPFPLGYLGLGDVFVLVFFGPVAVAGTYYVQALTVPPEVLLAGLAPGLFSTAILAVNNLRDADTDVKTGKRTLAVRFGKPFARWESATTLFLGGVVVPVALCVYTQGHWPALVSLVAFAAALPAIRTLFTTQDPAVMNGLLARTGGLLVLFTLLFSIGWLL